MIWTTDNAKIKTFVGKALLTMEELPFFFYSFLL